MEEDEAENGDTDGDLMPETPAAAVAATTATASPPFVVFKRLGGLQRRKRSRFVANLRHASPPPPPPPPPTATQESENDNEATSSVLSPRNRNGDACSDEDESGCCGSESPSERAALIRSEPTAICATSPRRRKWRSCVEAAKLRTRIFAAMRAVTPNFSGLAPSPPPPPQQQPTGMSMCASSGVAPPSVHLVPPGATFSSSLAAAHLSPFAPIGLPAPPALTSHPRPNGGLSFQHQHQHQQQQQHHHPQQPLDSLHHGLTLVGDQFETKQNRLCSPVTTWEPEVVASTTPIAQMEEPDSTTQLAFKTEPVSYLDDAMHASRIYCYASSPAPSAAAAATPLGPSGTAPFTGADCGGGGGGGAANSPVVPPSLHEPTYRPQASSYSFAGAYGGFETPTPVSCALAAAYQLESSRIEVVATTLASSSTSCLSAASSSTSPNGLGIMAASSSTTAMADPAAARSCGMQVAGGKAEDRQCRGGGSSGGRPGLGGRKPPPEAELSLYRNKMENVRCGVCADTAAGFHCGAYVCEACKKFYIRSHKADNANRYQCTKMGQCEVNKDTRTHCQYCRYKKCEILGMYPPGSKPNESSDISVIPCRVCGAQSSGFHFGAITCEGCKGFFRRTINERESNRYQCSKGGRCDVTVHTRNNCKSCRYMKCLAVGMSKTGSRIGRQPNAIKHMCAKEIEAIQSRFGFNLGRSATVPPPPPPPRPPPPPTVSTVAGLDKSGELALLSSGGGGGGRMSPLAPKLSPSSMSASPAGNGFAPLRSPAASVDPNELTSAGAILLPAREELSMRLLSEEHFLRVSQNVQVLREHGDIVALAAESLKMVAHRDPSSSQVLHHGFSVEKVWYIMMQHFIRHAQQVAQFACRVPGVTELDANDQVALVKEAMYPIILIMLGQCYDLTTGHYNYFNFTPEERDIIMRHFPSFTHICEHLTMSGSFIQQCAFDEKAIALMCAVQLTRSNSPEIVNRAAVDNLRLHCVGALNVYLSERSESVGRLQLSQIRYLEEMLLHMNSEHHNIIMELKLTHTSLKFPDLFVEMFQVEEKQLLEQPQHQPHQG